MYVILGATGNTGSVIAEALLARGEQVRALGRSKERLANLARHGAETLEGNLAETSFLTRAFTGARAVYFLLPPDPSRDDYRGTQAQITEAGAKAFEAARVHYAVVLSSLGAEKESGTGPIAGLRALETRFQKISTLNALYLRAGYFMENLLPQAGVIHNFGMMAGPVRGDLLLPMVATQDIGAAAAEHLLKLDFSGHQTHELLGQRDISYDEAAHVAGAAIGKPDLQYVQLPPDQIISAFLQMGISKNFAGLLVEMAAALNDGQIRALESRTAANTTATSIESFIQQNFAPTFRGKGVAA